MGVYDTLKSARTAQFHQHKLSHTHNFFGKLTTTGSGNSINLYLEGRDADENTEADAIFLPDDSLMIFQLSYVMLEEDGTLIDFQTSIHHAQKDGSANIAIDGDANAPNVIVQADGGTASDSVSPVANSDNDGIVLEAETGTATAYVHAQIEVLAFVSTNLDYLKFQSN